MSSSLCKQGSRLFLAASFFLCACVIPTLSVAQEAAPASAGATTEISIPQARELARRALAAGDIPVADAVSSAILADNPDDPQALLVRALIARGVGRIDEAYTAVVRAWRNAEIPALRFDIAMLAADIQARRENFTSAQIWLRRADQLAPDAQRRQVVGNAFRQVSRRNPLSVQLRFSARPSNNVNNGAEFSEFEFIGLPFSVAEQLSGYEIATGVSLAFRLSESETQKTELLGDLYFRKIWLSSDAKDKEPTAKGSDFDYGVLTLGVRQQRLIWPDVGPSRATALVGQSFYGGEALARWFEVQLGQTVAQGERGALNFGATMRTEKRLDSDINSSNALGLSADVSRRIEGGSFTYGAALKNVWSDSATTDHFATSLRASRSWRDVAGMRPTLRGTLEHRNYTEFTSLVDGREDISVSIGLDVVWPDVSFYGFSPQVSAQARRVFSNVELYDRNEYSVGLTAVSRF